MCANTRGERMCPASSLRFRSFQAGSTLWNTPGVSSVPYQPTPNPSDTERREILAVLRERVRGHLPPALAKCVRDVEDREVHDVVSELEGEDGELVASRDQLEGAELADTGGEGRGAVS